MHRSGAEKDNIAPPLCNIASPVQRPHPPFHGLQYSNMTVLYNKAGWGPQNEDTTAMVMQ